MLSVVKVLLKGEVGDCVLNSHGNYIVDHGKSLKNHGIVFLNFCGNPGNVFTFVQKCCLLILSVAYIQMQSRLTLDPSYTAICKSDHTCALQGHQSCMKLIPGPGL